MNYYLQAFRKYAVFSGRAQRAEYWYFFLINIIAVVVLSIVDYSLFIHQELLVINGMVINILILSPLYGLVTLIPGLAVSVRRMHDIDKSGWFLLIPIYNIVLLCTDGTKGSNRFGG